MWPSDTDFYAQYKNHAACYLGSRIKRSRTPLNVSGTESAVVFARDETTVTATAGLLYEPGA